MVSMFSIDGRDWTCICIALSCTHPLHSPALWRKFLIFICDTFLQFQYHAPLITPYKLFSAYEKYLSLLMAFSNGLCIPMSGVIRWLFVSGVEEQRDMHVTDFMVGQASLHFMSGSPSRVSARLPNHYHTSRQRIL